MAMDSKGDGLDVAAETTATVSVQDKDIPAPPATMPDMTSGQGTSSPTGDGLEEEDTVESAGAATMATTPPKTARKYYGLSSYLPKVPTMRMQKKDGKPSDPRSRTNSQNEENGGDPSDQRSSITDAPTGDKPASVPLASRLRGLSIDQNAFASSLVRRFSGFRAQTSNESPRNSLEGMAPQQRRSIIGSISMNVPSPRSDPNLKARRGACVATSFGTGTVIDIRLDDGFYIVQLAPKGMAYLREENIIREIKAVVGERVKTRWGLATVEQYYADEDMYSIALDWRWDDDHVWRMKATTKKFEKIKNNSIVQNTKNKIFEGYSSIRESASFGYANVAAKINTTASTVKAVRVPTLSGHAEEFLGKAITPYGVCSIIEVRPDEFFVVKTKCGATAYLNADSVKLLQRRTHFAEGERVKTPYGVGEIVEYRDEDEIYEIKLDIATAVGSMPPTLFISDIHAETMLLPANAAGAGARISSIFNMTRNSMFSASASVKASASGGFNTLTSVKSKVSTMAAIKMTRTKFQKGERVITSFGSGFITDVRPLDRIYEVQLRRLKFHGFFHESALQAFPYERVTHFIVDGKTIPAPEMPKNLPEHKRRQIITTAIRQARDGR